VPADRPLPGVREPVDAILEEMSPRFARLYSELRRASIARSSRVAEVREVMFNLTFDATYVIRVGPLAACTG